jgi:hypothetical protein
MADKLAVDRKIAFFAVHLLRYGAVTELLEMMVLLPNDHLNLRG